MKQLLQSFAYLLSLILLPFFGESQQQFTKTFLEQLDNGTIKANEVRELSIDSSSQTIVF